MPRTNPLRTNPLGALLALTAFGVLVAACDRGPVDLPLAPDAGAADVAPVQPGPYPTILTFEEFAGVYDHGMRYHNPYFGVTFSDHWVHRNQVYYGNAKSGVVRLRVAGSRSGEWLAWDGPVLFQGVWISYATGSRYGVYMVGYRDGVQVGRSATRVPPRYATWFPAGFTEPVDSVVFMNTVPDYWGSYWVIDDVTWLPAPWDGTGPRITPAVAGTRGLQEWYTSDVDVTWDVAGGTVVEGCADVTVTEDTWGETLRCVATGDGDAVSSLTIQRDATAPVVAYTGAEGTYTVADTIRAQCSASDALSGVVQSFCPYPQPEAWMNGIGTFTYNAWADDWAGNRGTTTFTFSVVVTIPAVCALTRRWVRDDGVADRLCRFLETTERIPAERGRAALMDAYRRTLEGEVGVSVSRWYADVLRGFLSYLE